MTEQKIIQIANFGTQGVPENIITSYQDAASGLEKTLSGNIKGLSTRFQGNKDARDTIQALAYGTLDEVARRLNESNMPDETKYQIGGNILTTLDIALKSGSNVSEMQSTMNLLTDYLGLIEATVNTKSYLGEDTKDGKIIQEYIDKNIEAGNVFNPFNVYKGDSRGVLNFYDIFMTGLAGQPGLDPKVFLSDAPVFSASPKLIQKIGSSYIQDPLSISRDYGLSNPGDIQRGDVVNGVLENSRIAWDNSYMQTTHIGEKGDKTLLDRGNKCLTPEAYMEVLFGYDIDTLRKTRLYGTKRGKCIFDEMSLLQDSPK